MNGRVYQKCHDHFLIDSQVCQISQHVENMTMYGHKRLLGGTFIYYLLTIVFHLLHVLLCFKDTFDQTAFYTNTAPSIRRSSLVVITSAQPQCFPLLKFYSSSFFQVSFTLRLVNFTSLHIPKLRVYSDSLTGI